jgi:hypothetical protein
MPVYKGSTEVTSGNLHKGSTEIENGYKASDSFFVNELDITAIGFSNSNIGSSGGNTNFVVTGSNNATYTLSGSGGATAPVGTHTISGSSDTQVISIGSNLTNCAPSRTPSVSVTPTGVSVFNPSNLPSSDTILQAASPNCIPFVTLSYNDFSGVISSNVLCDWVKVSGAGGCQIPVGGILTGDTTNNNQVQWSLQQTCPAGTTMSITVKATPTVSGYQATTQTFSTTF